MSIVLKRPMFRKGGQVDLQSGIAVVKPRKGYAKGDLVGDTDTDPDLIAANIKPDDDAGLENYAIGDVMSDNKTGARDEDLYLQNADPDSVDDYITRALLSDTSLQSQPDLSKIESTANKPSLFERALGMGTANADDTTFKDRFQNAMKQDAANAEARKNAIQNATGANTPASTSTTAGQGYQFSQTPLYKTVGGLYNLLNKGSAQLLEAPVNSIDMPLNAITKFVTGYDPNLNAQSIFDPNNEYGTNPNPQKAGFLPGVNPQADAAKADADKAAADAKIAEQKKQVTTTGTGGAGTTGGVNDGYKLSNLQNVKTIGTASSTTAVNPYQTIIDTIKKSIMPTQEEQARNFYSNLFANMANVPLNQRTSLGQAVGSAAITNATRANELEKEAAKYGALGAIKEIGNQKFGSAAEQGTYNSAYNITKLQNPNATEAEAQLAGYKAVLAERQKTAPMSKEESQLRNITYNSIKEDPAWKQLGADKNSDYIDFIANLKKSSSIPSAYFADPKNVSKYTKGDYQTAISPGLVQRSLTKDANGNLVLKNKDDQVAARTFANYNQGLYYNPVDSHLYKYDGTKFIRV